MNPFDGRLRTPRAPTHTEGSSYQAAHANAWLNLQICTPVRPGSVSHGRHWRVLRLVPHDTMYDRTFHRASVHGIRVHVEGHEPDRTLRPLHTLFRRRNCWWFCGRVYHTSGRHQDIAADPRKCSRRGATERVRSLAGRKDHQAKRRIQRVLPWVKTQDHHHNAQHGHLLVSAATPVLPTLANVARSAYEMAKAFFIRRSTDPSTNI